jgi:hypothetical protein
MAQSSLTERTVSWVFEVNGMGFLEWAVSTVTALGMILPSPDGTLKQFNNLRTPAELNSRIQTRLLASRERALASTQRALKDLEQQNDPSKQFAINFLKSEEVRLLREVQNLRGGNIRPIAMPVVPSERVRP